MSAQVVKPNTVPTKRLSASITPSSTTFRVSDTFGWDGVALAPTDLGDQAYGCFRDASGTMLELFEYDPSTIANANITFIRRGLMFTGDRTTSVTANKLTWIKNTTLVELGTSMPQFFQWLKEYIDAAAIAGGVPATISVLGLNKMSVAPVSAASPVAVGDNDTRVLQNAYGVATGSVNAFVLAVSATMTAYTAGQIFCVKANNTNTGSTTLNVNALGAKTIKKDGATNLVAGEILTGQIFWVQYDGTNFQILRGPSLLDVQTFTGSGTWTKPGNVTMARIQVWGGGGGGTGGGGAATGSNNCPGGGGGGYNERIIPISSLGLTETVTIGAGGTAGVQGGTPTPPGDGGNTTFGTWLTGWGGGGGGDGSTGTQVGGAGGGTISAAVRTTIGSPGSPIAGVGASGAVGGDGMYSGGGAGATAAASFKGGDSFYGGAGGGSVHTTVSVGAGGVSKMGGNGGAGVNGTGVSGAQPGGGGGGGSSLGGVGGAGQCIVTCW